MKQEEVANRIGVTRRAIYEWENGIREPRSALPALAEVYGVTTHQLLYGVDPPSIELREIRTQLDRLQAQVADLAVGVVEILAALGLPTSPAPEADGDGAHALVDEQVR